MNNHLLIVIFIFLFTLYWYSSPRSHCTNWHASKYQSVTEYDKGFIRHSVTCSELVRLLLSSNLCCEPLLNQQAVCVNVFYSSFPLVKVFVCTVAFPLWSKASLREGNGPLFQRGNAVGRSPGNGQTAVSLWLAGMWNAVFVDWRQRAWNRNKTQLQ